MYLWKVFGWHVGATSDKTVVFRLAEGEYPFIFKRGSLSVAATPPKKHKIDIKSDNNNDKQ